MVFPSCFVLFLSFFDRILYCSETTLRLFSSNLYNVFAFLYHDSVFDVFS